MHAQFINERERERVRFPPMKGTHFNEEHLCRCTRHTTNRNIEIILEIMTGSRMYLVLWKMNLVTITVKHIMYFYQGHREMATIVLYL